MEQDCMTIKATDRPLRRPAHRRAKLVAGRLPLPPTPAGSILEPGRP